MSKFSSVSRVLFSYTCITHITRNNNITVPNNIKKDLFLNAVLVNRVYSIRTASSFKYCTSVQVDSSKTYTLVGRLQRHFKLRLVP